MAKKHWIYIKRGLSEDVKHRAAMGECIWLYMHIIDRADWETGIAYDWKDREEAVDMGMAFETLRDQRQKLEKLDYIRCIQKQRGQDIQIMEWRNPREYGSEVRNPRFQGDALPPPSEFQGDAHGDAQVSSQPVTPTNIDSKSYSHPDKNKLDIPEIVKSANKSMDKILEYAGVGEEIAYSTHFFEEALGFGSLPWGSNHTWKKFQRWVAGFSNDLGKFKEYAIWRRGEGQYKGAMTNTSIRRDPQIFMDTGWPNYLAYTSMSKKPATLQNVRTL